MLRVAMTCSRAYGTFMGIAETKLALKTRVFEEQKTLFFDEIKQGYGSFALKFFEDYQSCFTEMFTRIGVAEETRSNLIYLGLSAVWFVYRDVPPKEDGVVLSCYLDLRFLGSGGTKTIQYNNIPLISVARGPKRYLLPFAQDALADTETLTVLLELRKMLHAFDNRWNSSVQIAVFPELVVTV